MCSMYLYVEPNVRNQWHMSLFFFCELTLPVHTLSWVMISQFGKVISTKLVRRKRMSKQARDDRTSTKYFLRSMSRWWRTQIDVTFPITPKNDMNGITTAYITHRNVPPILQINKMAILLQCCSAVNARMQHLVTESWHSSLCFV